MGNAYPHINNIGEIVWQRHGDGDSSEIYLYNPFNQISLRITDNIWADTKPKIDDNGNILWEGWQGPPHNNKIYYKNNDNIIQITDGSYPVISYYQNNKGQFVWSGGNNGSGFYIWENSITTKLTTSGGQSLSGHQINDNGKVVFTKYESGLYKIFLYDTNTNNITKIAQNESINNWKPQINNLGQILWEGWSEGGAI